MAPAPAAGFIDAFASLPAGEIGRRWDLAQALLRDNGVTYNIHGDRAGLDRPWQLDPLPVILPAAEWADLSAAIAQRAGLLDSVLADLHGRRGLIADGLLPPGLLYANPAFQRACHGWQPWGGRHLQLYAADLGRGADGVWRVLTDHAEVPAGAGYALENRTIVTRVLPEMHRSLPVERLGPFFDTLRRSLLALAPRRTEQARMVLMTPGPLDEAYFEHAFLARQLGITLVEGEDLTVRDRTVFLKTLTGLQRVDVILRHIDGEWCDPLELRGDSAFGVAGLVQAARAGNVALANALGAGLVDGAQMMPFLPAIAENRLGQTLALPSVPSWWCGTPDGLETVRASFDRLALRPAFRPRVSPVLPALLTPGERAALAQAVEHRPWEWVAQAVDDLAAAPVWHHGRLEPRPITLRVFAVAGERGWTVMAGGLVRVADPRRPPRTGLATGGGISKDLWVLSAARAPSPAASRPLRARVTLVRGSRDLPSRVADDMFWLGRNLERCEATTRLLRAALQRTEEALDQGDGPRAAETLATVGRLGLALPPGLGDHPAPQLPRRVVEFHAGTHAGSLADHAARMIRLAGSLRDRLSLDTWRALQRLKDEVAALTGRDRRSDTQGRLNQVVLTAEAVSGLAMENMTRGPMWLFWDTGRRVERATAIADTLGGALSEAVDEQGVPMDLLLEIWDSVMTYRSRYLAAPRLAAVLDLLMCDENNPRALAFQLAALERHMDRLVGISGETGFLRPEQRLMTVLCGIVRTTDVGLLADDGQGGGFVDAERLLEQLRSRLWELSEVISREYFTHAQWRLPLAPMDPLP
ncbi:circularly permuted type 2 ATP-grasp protein [Phaeospirillum tilakii]|uniref:Circularly permuted type 2 ATP-grasp protein n=1 Tax=Phaeospirillum tilakii TaxID=741673 RepID=A0ABW5CDF3_9PROT